MKYAQRTSSNAKQGVVNGMVPTTAILAQHAYQKPIDVTSTTRRIAPMAVMK